jgi:hypothetical protein
MTCQTCGKFRPNLGTYYSYSGPICTCTYQMMGMNQMQYEPPKSRDAEIARLLIDILEEIKEINIRVRQCV